MTIALRSRLLGFALAFVASAGTLVVSNSAHAQPDPGTGASADKNCPGATATLGETITCTFTVTNTGDFPAQVTTLEEQSPFPSGTPVNISCTAGGAVITEGGTLTPDTPCNGSFVVTIPNDPAICNTFVLDRVELGLTYTQFPQPLFAGAFATEVTLVACPADIEITKTADELGKVGDSITYTFEICNVGDATANRGSVTDTLLGDITASFPASLAPDQCVTVEVDRTVADGDPDPLPNTVTATYSVGIGPFQDSDTATASASTELFQPGLSVTKTCTPDPVVVGGSVSCTIVVTNTSSADSPGLINGTIVDTLTGNLLDPANPAVVDASSNCTASLATGASCTIVTERTVLDNDPNPLVNVVTVHYNPSGFPNDVTATAEDSVTRPGTTTPSTTTTTTTTATTTTTTTTTITTTTTVPGTTITVPPTTSIPSALPVTGTSSGVTFAAAVGMIALGAAALLLGRRRAS